MSESHSKSKPDGAAFDDFFESLGKKAEHLSLNDAAPKAQVSSSAHESVGALPDDFAVVIDDTDEQKVVDEIESLCMNCHENVSISAMLFAYFNHANRSFHKGYHTPPADSYTILPRNHNYV